MRKSLFPSLQEWLSETWILFRYDWISVGRTTNFITLILVFAAIFGSTPYIIGLYAGTFQTVGKQTQPYSASTEKIPVVVVESSIAAALGSFLSSTGHYRVAIADQSEADHLLKKGLVHAMVTVESAKSDVSKSEIGAEPLLKLRFDSGYASYLRLCDLITVDLTEYIKREQDSRIEKLGVSSPFHEAVFTIKDALPGPEEGVSPRLRAPLISGIILMLAVLSGLAGQYIQQWCAGETLLVVPIKRKSFLASNILSSTAVIFLITIFMVPISLLLFIWNPLPGPPPIIVQAPPHLIFATILLCLPQALLFSTAAVCIALFRQDNSLKLVLLQSLMAQALVMGIWSAPKAVPVLSAFIPVSNMATAMSQVLSGKPQLTYIWLSVLVTLLYTLPVFLLAERFVNSDRTFSKAN